MAGSRRFRSGGRGGASRQGQGVPLEFRDLLFVLVIVNDELHSPKVRDRVSPFYL